MIDEIMKIMEVAQQSFFCLRCGHCCWAYSFTFPNGEEKEEHSYCPHLKNRKLVGDTMQPAACRIHRGEGYPWECRDFVVGLGVCPIGKQTWLRELEKHPGSRLPPDIEKHIR